MSKVKALKEGIWKAAGWGSPYCPKCKSELKRVVGAGGIESVSCPKCFDKNGDK